MKIIITTLSMLLFFTTFSQTAIKKSSIDSGGASVTNGTISMVYTLGEVAVQENTNGTTHISEGFLSPDMINTVGLDDYSSLTGVQFYPNPVVAFATVVLPEVGSYTITIYDLLGKEVISYKTNNTNTEQIDLKHLPKAVYMMLITNEATKQFTSYKIIKE